MHAALAVLAWAPLGALLVIGCATPRQSPPLPAARDAGAGEPVVDFARLRIEYGDRDDFHAVCERDRPVSRLFELAGRRDWERSLAVARTWLKACPVDIDAHFISAVALEELGRPAESREHQRWFRGLVESVLASGDGRTPATAYVVISVFEEYSVLRALRLRHRSQVLLKEQIDALAVEREDGSRTTVYFNPAAHFRRLKKRPAAPR
jgi:hypothetical protein